MRFNRWPHGYTHSYNLLFDPPEWAFEAGDILPVVAARNPFGRIVIAGVASVPSSHTDAANLEARAVGGLAVDQDSAQVERGAESRQWKRFRRVSPRVGEACDAWSCRHPLRLQLTIGSVAASRSIDYCNRCLIGIDRCRLGEDAA